MRKRGAKTLGKRSLGLAGALFVLTFLACWYVITPEAPGRPELKTYVVSRTTDQHFANCSEARAAGRENIPWFDPSYRPAMDADGDGLACEPPRGSFNHVRLPRL
jgi:hypothetical protein